MKQFYVYAHIDPFTSKPFYIGKGTEGRMYSATRNPMWKSYVNDYLAGQGMTLRTDKVNQVLSMFGSCLVPYQRTV